MIDAKPPQSVTLHARAAGTPGFRAFPLSSARGFRYETTIPAATFTGETVEFYFTARTGNADVRFPEDGEKLQTAKLLAPNTPLALFDAARDISRLVYTRIGDGVRYGIFQRREATKTEPAALRLFFPLSYDRTLDDYTASLAIKNTIANSGLLLSAAKVMRVKARGEGDGQQIHVTLVEADGTSWSKQLTLSTNWQEHSVSLTEFKPARAVKLPLGFPGRWNYWLAAPKGRGGPDDRPRLGAIEHLQISFRPTHNAPASQTDAWADINSIVLTPE